MWAYLRRLFVEIESFVSNSLIVGRAGSFGRTFSLDGDSRGYPIVMLSFQGVINGHLRIIHGNQRDRNSGGEI